MMNASIGRDQALLVYQLARLPPSRLRRGAEHLRVMREREPQLRREFGSVRTYRELLAALRRFSRLTMNDAIRATPVGALGFPNRKAAISYVIRRDGHRCGICRGLVRASSGEQGPSLDHIVPVSRGGAHELRNIQLAHLRCNRIKHNGLVPHGEQRRLFG